MSSVSVFIFSTLGYLITSVLLIVWHQKHKRAGTLRKTTKIAYWIFSVLITLSYLGVMLPSIITPPESPTILRLQTYYIKPEIANVRECPSTDCAVIDTLSQNTTLKVPGSVAEKNPGWIEVTFSDDTVGYVSMSVLSDTIVLQDQQPAGGAGSSDAIYLASWTLNPAIKNKFYFISFCEPDSARSGATCGNLAGATTNPTGGNPPYSFVKSSGFLPPGMSLELNGFLSGTPTVTGTYNFKLCAKDLQMNQGCRDYTLAVKTQNTDSTILNESQNGQLPLENNNASLTITSGRCGEKFEDPEHITGDMWAGVFFEGDVSGPIGAVLFLSTSGYDKINCGEWSLSGTVCVRENASQPQTTHWSVSLGSWNWIGYFVASGFVSGLVGGNSVNLAEAEQRINCVR